HLARIIRRAGLTPWPKLCNNLRASRETELAEQFPMHVVCAWIGNTERVAAKHYLQVTEEHFRLARGQLGGGESGAAAVQNPVQHPAAPSRTESQDETEDPGGCEIALNRATDRDAVRVAGRFARRLEPARHGHLLLRVELHRLRPLDVQIAKERIVPAG